MNIKIFNKINKIILLELKNNKQKINGYICKN